MLLAPGVSSLATNYCLKECRVTVMVFDRHRTVGQALMNLAVIANMDFPSTSSTAFLHRQDWHHAGDDSPQTRQSFDKFDRVEQREL